MEKRTRLMPVHKPIKDEGVMRLPPSGLAVVEGSVIL